MGFSVCGQPQADEASKRVAILEGQAYTDFFQENSGASRTKKFNPSELRIEGNMRDVWALLKADEVDAVYTGSSEAKVFVEAESHAAIFEESFVGPAGSEGVGYMCRPEFGDETRKMGATRSQGFADAWPNQRHTACDQKCQ